MAIKCIYTISIVFVLSLFCSTTSLRHHIAPCDVVRPCVCEFPSGEGLDLSVLSNTTFRSSIVDINTTVLFQPCHNITVQNVSTCNQSSLCLFNNATNQSTPLGNIDEIQFKSENLFKPVTLQFMHTEISTTVELACQEVGNETSFNGTKINDKEYHFVLISPAACIKPLLGQHGRGFFSVLFITVFILFISYVVVCVVVRRSRGAVGWEMLPHYETCMRIPGACRAGCTSLLTCCRQPSYEQI